MLSTFLVNDSDSGWGQVSATAVSNGNCTPQRRDFGAGGTSYSPLFSCHRALGSVDGRPQQLRDSSGSATAGRCCARDWITPYIQRWPRRLEHSGSASTKRSNEQTLRLQKRVDCSTSFPLSSTVRRRRDNCSKRIRRCGMRFGRIRGFWRNSEQVALGQPSRGHPGPDFSGTPRPGTRASDARERENFTSGGDSRTLSA